MMGKWMHWRTPNKTLQLKGKTAEKEGNSLAPNDLDLGKYFVQGHEFGSKSSPSCVILSAHCESSDTYHCLGTEGGMLLDNHYIFKPLKNPS